MNTLRKIIGKPKEQREDKGKQMADGDNFFKVEDTDEIMVMTDTGKIIPLKIKGSDTIGILKLMIQAAEDIPFDAQELILNEKVLDNIKTLANLRIKKQSTLTLMLKMEIFVITFREKTISLWVKPTYTIASVKWLIRHKEQIPIDQQVLIFNSMVLGDSGTLFDFHIETQSSITLMHKPRRFSRFMWISILTLTGETISLEVKPSYTINDVKSKIKDKIKVPCDEQELIFNEIVLSDISNLFDFHITNGSTLTLMRISSGFMKIFIKPLTERTFALDVKPSDTIDNVKSRIHDKKRIQPRQQDLIFKGNRLLDGATITDYDILKGSTVDLVIR